MPLSELITAATKQLKIKDPMTAEEFVNTDEDVTATEELGENWEKELVEDFINNQTHSRKMWINQTTSQRRVKQKKNVPLKTSLKQPRCHGNSNSSL